MIKRIAPTVAAALMLAACSSNSEAPAPAAAPTSPASESASTSAPASPPASPEDAIDAATKVAQEEADRYSAEDYAGSWDLWTNEGKAAISQADYVKYHEVCPGPGVSYKVVNVRESGPNEVTARLKVATFLFSYKLKFEEGEWRWQPNDDDLVDYKAGVDAMIKKAKEEGNC